MPPLPPSAAAVLDVLTASPTPLTAAEISGRLPPGGPSRHTVVIALQSLMDEGLVDRVGRPGLYAVSPEPPRAA